MSSAAERPSVDLSLPQEPKRLTRVEPSLHPWEAVLKSERLRRLARKWPWSWRCTVCEEAYGAGKTQLEAQQAADRHELSVHDFLAEQAQEQTPPTDGDQVT